MTAPRPFAKYEGLGNDFVVLDARDWPSELISPELARALCDRHTGIGADGILWLDAAPAGSAAAARLVILNADGSRPEMCGNGVRCVAAYLHHAGRLARGATLALETDAGARPAVVLDADARTSRVEVEVAMGPVRFDPRRPRVEVPGVGGVEAVPVDLGNPHAVVFAHVPDEARLDVVRALEAVREVFPRGVNVEFVAPLSELPPSPPSASGARAGFAVAVHERGVGWTQACGTGACAVAAAATLAARDGARAGEPVAVDLAGGRLLVTIEPPATAGDGWRVGGADERARGEAGLAHARMRGPARRVFAGTVDAAPLVGGTG